MWPTRLCQLIEKQLRVRLSSNAPSVELHIPFKIGKAKRGAIVIRPEYTPKDIFDLPPDKLRKVVQGLIWRDEHFSGMALKDIAIREKCSEAYVGTAIFGGFDLLLNRSGV